MEEGSGRIYKMKRGTFEGVKNIVRFNWHFYLLAGLVFISLIIFGLNRNGLGGTVFVGIAFLLILPVVISLVVSWMIYDRSELYDLGWVAQDSKITAGSVVNIHAGYDESSPRIREIYPSAQLSVLDFYDPELHTEISIRRARKYSSSFPGTIVTGTAALPLPDDSVENMHVFLAAHEIRNTEERLQFFQEIRRSMKAGGKVYVTEHLRDLSNFLAFNIGAFHFFSRKSWLDIFRKSGLELVSETKITPYISAFTLEKH